MLGSTTRDCGIDVAPVKISCQFQAPVTRSSTWMDVLSTQ